MLLQKVLPEQGLLETQEQWQAILKFFGDDEIAPKLDGMWASSSRHHAEDINIARWEELQLEVAKISKVISAAHAPCFSFKAAAISTIVSLSVKIRQMAELAFLGLTVQGLCAAKGLAQDPERATSCEGDHAGSRLPALGCGGLQKDEPPAQGPILRAPKDWQGKPAPPSPFAHFPQQASYLVQSLGQHLQYFGLLIIDIVSAA